MVVDRKATTESLGRAFAEAIRGDDAVRELWVARDSEGFVVSLFADDHERKLYGHASSVQRQFPDALFEVHVRLPSRYTYESFDEMRDAVLPDGARKVSLGP